MSDLSSTNQDQEQDLIHLLLVEDDPPTQTFMKAALGKGFAVHPAPSAEEARIVLDQYPIRIILMDLSIKGKEDGIEFTRWLRNSEAWKKTPIIALTAHAYDRDRQNAIHAGCNAYFSKPFDRKQLLEKIRELLKQ